MDTTAVESLIWELAGARQAMGPRRAETDPGPGSRIAGGTGMRWYVEAGPEAGSVQLLLLQQGLGWVGITLDAPGADALTSAIEQARKRD